MRINSIFIVVDSDEVGRAARVVDVLERLPLPLRNKVMRVEDGEGHLVVDVREDLSQQECHRIRDAWAQENEPSGEINFAGQRVFDFFDGGVGVSA